MFKKYAFHIDLTQAFEHLPNAPIVEAVIHWRARAEKKLVPGEFLEQLQQRLPDYPVAQRQQEVETTSSALRTG